MTPRNAARSDRPAEASVAASTEGPTDLARAQELRGDGQSLHFHVTSPGLTGEWLVTRTPSGVTVARGHGKADVAVRGPAASLLLVLTRRLPPPNSGHTGHSARRARTAGDAEGRGCGTLPERGDRANSANIRPGRRLTIEATVNL